MLPAFTLRVSRWESDFHKIAAHTISLWLDLQSVLAAPALQWQVLILAENSMDYSTLQFQLAFPFCVYLVMRWQENDWNTIRCGWWLLQFAKPKKNPSRSDQRSISPAHPIACCRDQSDVLRRPLSRVVRIGPALEQEGSSEVSSSDK